MSKYKEGEQIELFKEYALELVIAVGKPLHKNGVIMGGSSKCIPIIDKDKEVISLDTVLVTILSGRTPKFAKKFKSKTYKRIDEKHTLDSRCTPKPPRDFPWRRWNFYFGKIPD